MRRFSLGGRLEGKSASFWFGSVFVGIFGLVFGGASHKSTMMVPEVDRISLEGGSWSVSTTQLHRPNLWKVWTGTTTHESCFATPATLAAVVPEGKPRRINFFFPIIVELVYRSSFGLSAIRAAATCSVKILTPHDPMDVLK